MTNLQTQLSKICPSVLIETKWDIDETMGDIRNHCDGMDDVDPDDWTAWSSEIRASAIVKGVAKHGSYHLGGTWEKAGDVPWKSNPDISGYEHQMTMAALEELLEEINKFDDDSDAYSTLTEDIIHASLVDQIKSALIWLFEGGGQPDGDLEIK